MSKSPAAKLDYAARRELKIQRSKAVLEIFTTLMVLNNCEHSSRTLAVTACHMADVLIEELARTAPQEAG